MNIEHRTSNVQHRMRRKAGILFICQLLFIWGCQNKENYYYPESKWKVDILKEQQKIHKAKLILLKGNYNHAGTAGIAEGKSLIVGPFICKIDKKVEKPINWHKESLKGVFNKYTPKTFEDCWCAPKYKMALLFFNKDDHQIGAMLFDDQHDSIVVSDNKHGIRIFRFSIGHKGKISIEPYLKLLFKEAGKEYKN